MHTESKSKPIDNLLEAMADELNRRVLASLSAGSDDVVSLNELVDGVVSGSDGRDAERVAIRLHHVSLPKLDEAGVLDYDAEENVVRYSPTPDVESLLDYLRERDA